MRKSGQNRLIGHLHPSPSLFFFHFNFNLSVEYYLKFHKSHHCLLISSKNPHVEFKSSHDLRIKQLLILEDQCFLISALRSCPSLFGVGRMHEAEPEPGVIGAQRETSEHSAPAECEAAYFELSVLRSSLFARRGKLSVNSTSLHKQRLCGWGSADSLTDYSYCADRWHTALLAS